MKKIHLPLAAALLLAAAAHAETTVVTDGFDTYGANAVLAMPNWNVKWDGGDATQQNLITMSGTNDYAVLDTSVAKRNYHAINQTSWTMSAGTTATIGFDFRYDHLAGGDITGDFNKAFLAVLVSTNNAWWASGVKTFNIVNRGSAIGSSLQIAPWVEGWVPHASVGVDTTAGGLSDTLRVELLLTDNGTTILGQASIFNGASLLYTSTEYDMVIASASTLYAGFTTGFNNVGNIAISEVNNIDSIQIDNFSVTTVPEPSTFALLAGMFALGSVMMRRRS
ncbi:MAG: PEP-CTERM sorting domain-containing protein [Opitutales bacterium]|nr:PEP-CTERM sorting domain-containing protein [Opitutales bacterium]